MPIPVVSTHYSQSTTADWSEVVRCPSCGHSVKAYVVTHGTGRGRAVYGIGKDAARERAGQEAFDRALSLAKELVRLSRCPRCRKRFGGVGWLGFKIALTMGFIGATVYGPVRFMMDAAEASLRWTNLAAFLIWGLTFWIARAAFRRKLRIADGSVRFEAVSAVPARR